MEKKNENIHQLTVQKFLQLKMSKVLQHPSEKISKSTKLMTIYRWFNNNIENNTILMPKSCQFLGRKQLITSLVCRNRSFSQKQGTVADHLKYVSQLKSLKIDFYVISVTRQNNFLPLSKTLQKLKYLQTLQIKVSFYNVKMRYGLDKLLQAARKSAALSNLDVEFKGTPDMTDQVLQLIMDKVLKLHKLEAFTLCLDGCYKITDQSLAFIGEKLRSLDQLQTLKLFFYGCKNLSDNGVETLINQLSSLKCLNTLSLNFSGCSDFTNLTTIDVDLRLVALKNIQLNFTVCPNVGDEYLSSINTLLLKRTVNITSLDLTFFRCDKITDEGVIACLEGLSFISSIELFNFDISWCDKITDNGLIALIDEIKGLRNLKQLKLVFTRCNLLSDRAIMSLSKIILNFKKLQFLELNFSGCKEITDQGIEALTSSLSQFKGRLITNIELDRCLQISLKALETLHSILQKIQGSK